MKVLPAYLFFRIVALYFENPEQLLKAVLP